MAEEVLGEVYYEGLFIKCNAEEAERWLSRFAQGGEMTKYTLAETSFMRGMLYYQQHDPRYYFTLGRCSAHRFLLSVRPQSC